MSTIKFKNGTKWEELSLGGSNLLDQYPVGSIYASPKVASFTSLLNTNNAPTSSETQALLNSIKSPSETIGGTWSNVYTAYSGMRPVEFYGGYLSTRQYSEGSFYVISGNSYQKNSNVFSTSSGLTVTSVSDAQWGYGKIWVRIS